MPYETEAQALRAGREAFPAFPASVLAQAPRLPFLRSDCESWNVPAAPGSIRDVTRRDIPTLVLSGGFDTPTTPNTAWLEDVKSPKFEVAP
ncbi:hypothetical protein ACGFNX_15145 [Streptomyces sp. NPDC048723]|uniref:hypothetical protein n=1 Tax=unclassified Streptomyces TaxID=2593676 RepID=UPI000AA281B4